MSPSLLIALWVSAVVAGQAPAEAATPGLTLADAVRVALRTEPAVASAKIARDRSRLATLRAQLDRFSLRIDAQIQELWFKTNIAGSRGDSEEGGLGLSNVAARLEVPLFSGLRVESAVRRNQHLEEAAGFDMADERRAAALAVARAYWSVRRLSLLREVESQALERLADAEATAAARVRSGIAPPIDENRARARRLLQEITLADLAGQHHAERGRLMALLGTPRPIQLVDSPVGPRPAPAAVVELLEAARGRRPDLSSAKARIAAQAQVVDIALSGYYPQLNGFALYQHGNNPALAGANASAVFGTADPFNNLAGDLQLGLTLSINLFDTFNTYTAVKDARYEASRLAQESVRVGRVIDAEVRVARANVVRFLGLIAQLEEARALARDNVTINRCPCLSGSVSGCFRRVERVASIRSRRFDDEADRSAPQSEADLFGSSHSHVFDAAWRHHRDGFDRHVGRAPRGGRGGPVDTQSRGQ